MKSGHTRSLSHNTGPSYITGSDSTLDNAHVAEDYLAGTTTMYRIIASW
jgi:hypothetical protein